MLIMNRGKKKNGEKYYSRWLRIALPVALIVAWLAVAGAGGPLFGRISEVSKLDLAAFLPDSAESTKVQDELPAFIDTDSISALVVYESKSGKLSEAVVADITKSTARLDDIDGIAKSSIMQPTISDDKKSALVVVPVGVEAEVADVVGEMRAELAESSIESTSHFVTGPAGFSADLNEAFSGIDGLLLVVALAVVFVILVIVYRSPILPIIVLMTSLLALAAAILVVFSLAKSDVVTINGQVQGILFILVIGAATDYSLLYVARYREELYYQASKVTATIKALKGSFEPVLASGGTVIAGLLCLLLSDLASNQALGPVGSIGVLLAMTSALTFLPSVLALVGRKAFWPMVPRADKASQRKHQTQIESGLWSKVGGLVSRHPRRIWITTIAILAVATLGIFQLKADGIAQSELISGYSEAREGQDVLAKHYSDGFGAPMLIVTEEGKQSEIVDVLDGISSIDGVAITTDAEQGAVPAGQAADDIRTKVREQVEHKYNQQVASIKQNRDQIADQYGQEAAEQMYREANALMPSVDELVAEKYPFTNVVPTAVDGRVLLQATLNVAPDSEAGQDTVEQVRNQLQLVDDDVLVGGVTAIQYDTNQASIHDRQVIIPAVLVAITIILMVLLRSVVAPLMLLGTTVLSFGTALGVSALVFNHVLGLPGADPAVILYGFVFLVALGIDYNIFLMTRVREESLKVGTKKGVIKGLVVTGSVITSAGVVLAATFAALTVIPILFLLQIAFMVAFGVLLDTIVVRSLLVPSLIRDIGHKVWWPAKLK